MGLYCLYLNHNSIFCQLSETLSRKSITVPWNHFRGNKENNLPYNRGKRKKLINNHPLCSSVITTPAGLGESDDRFQTLSMNIDI